MMETLPQALVPFGYAKVAVGIDTVGQFTEIFNVPLVEPYAEKVRVVGPAIFQSIVQL